MAGRVYDIAVIGGGINGCGVARDASGRGLSVFVAEKSDLASGTSSKSTKLIHGGLRYLEHNEFMLVRSALKEREVLWAMAPHIIWPLRFILPHHKDLRPTWLIRLGLFLYDHLGGRKVLPPSNGLDLTKDEASNPLNSNFTRAFEYSDCWVDDARLVVINAMDAAKRGADIRTRTKVIAAKRDSDLWQLVTVDNVSGEKEFIHAKTLVNASGPWVSEVISQQANLPSKFNIRLVQGSHVVVPKIFDHDRAYIFQNADDRIIFAIPYENDFTLIGTTDEDYKGELSEASISQGEIDYLCASASKYFSTPVSPNDVVWTYSGVRPLFDEGGGEAHEATRDYVLDLQGKPGEPPLLNVFGGKITTYRRLAEEALKKLSPWLSGKDTVWTSGAPLPGGDFPVEGLADLTATLKTEFSMIDEALIQRLVRSYGTCVRDILVDVKEPNDLGLHFGAGLYQSEVTYLVRHEWALTAEDIVWRRSKLGLKMTKEEIFFLDEWLQENYAILVDLTA
ncbi:MAG: glycerol-3-phosphate dehydrogenase [Rhodospirillales bacterium]|nr:glycerol-3-phosphate dehydrogenase [Rhodospirillales bacterium]